MADSLAGTHGGSCGWSSPFGTVETAVVQLCCLEGTEHAMTNDRIHRRRAGGVGPASAAVSPLVEAALRKRMEEDLLAPSARWRIRGSLGRCWLIIGRDLP